MRWISCTLWRVLQQNPWGLAGGAIARAQAGVRHLRAHLLKWYDAEGVDHGVRIADLTLPMLGSAGTDPTHRGTPMTTKAAETKALLPWVLTVLHDLGQDVPFHEELAAAGVAMQSYLALLKASSPHKPQQQQKTEQKQKRQGQEQQQKKQ